MTRMQRWLDKFIAIPASWFIRTKVVPADVQKELDIDPAKPIIYLLKSHSVTDLVALQKACRQRGLPDPQKGLQIQQKDFDACLFLNRTQGVFSASASDSDIAHTFTRLFQLHAEHKELDVQIVPVTSFWGRAPDKSEAGWRDLIADKASPSWLRKCFIVLFSGRQNMVYFSRAVSSRYMVDQRLGDADAAHKLIRVARTHFQRRRQAVVGPRQMARTQIIEGVLRSDAVQEAIAESNKGEQKAMAEARKYAEEIAGDYRDGLVRLGDKLLSKLWNKIYNGIDVRHARKVRELADAGHEIVYVPCHRSHMDYLLLTYVIFHEGLMTPHIAAGINLNFFPAGPIFRRAGAFFIRRSFAGNKIYTAVFKAYLQQLFTRGYPVKYYCEGGRSRTGRLLTPKTGMLAMTIQSLFTDIKRPITLVPVYIGYEHVMEVASYLKELQGTQKQKESVFQVFSAIRKLKNYGHGYVNFGQPVNLSQYLEQQVPAWRQDVAEEPDKKPAWLTPVTNKLATHLMQRINQSGAINGMTLCATCILASDKLSMTERELRVSFKHLLGVLQQAPYSEQMTIPRLSAEQMLGETLSLNKFTLTQDSIGQIVSLDAKSAIAMTYYRNNILHLIAVPSLLAAMLTATNGMEKSAILERMEMLFPLLQRELFLYHQKSEFIELVNQTLLALKQQGMIETRGRKWQPVSRDAEAFLPLWVLSRNAQDTLQRYAVILTQVSHQPGLSRAQLEKHSIRAAERLTAVHGINAPEFYDKGIIASLVAAMKDNQLLAQRDDGAFHPTEQSAWLLQELLHWLHPQVTQSIKQTGSGE